MMSDKPMFGIVFSLLASVMMLAVWVRTIAIGPISSIELLEWGGPPPWSLSVITRLAFAIAWAVLISIGALALYFAPRQHSLGGAIILTFSIVTLLLWASGYIWRYLSGIYIGSPFSFLWRSWITGLIKILYFDLLAIASILGIIGGVLAVLWQPKSTVASVKQLEAKYSLLGVVSAILAFSSLALPWWEDMLRSRLFPWGMDTNVFIWILLGDYTVAMYSALAFILIGGCLALIGSWVIEKKRRILLAASGIFVTLSIVVFTVGLAYSNTGWHIDHEHFPPLFFASRDRLAFLSFGFWTALVAAVLAFISSFRHPPIPSKTSSS